MGRRTDTGIVASGAAFGLLLLLRFCLIWVGILFGLLVPSTEAAGGLYAVAFPLTMISSVFVPPSTIENIIVGRRVPSRP